MWQFAGHKVQAVAHAGSTEPASAGNSGGSMAGMDMHDMQNMPVEKGAKSSSGEESMAGTEMQGMNNMPAGTVMLDTATQQRFIVTYTKVRRAHLVRTIQTVGLLHADEEKIARVHVKAAGWIQEAFLSYVGQEIKKGQPLFTLYSPDLVSTEQEYLIALRGQKYLSKAAYTDVSLEANSLLAALCKELVALVLFQCYAPVQFR
ncbi:MAG: efflux RND transporter periplasmic adaptor subunit [Acidobacteriaceae bacterium]